MNNNLNWKKIKEEPIDEYKKKKTFDLGDGEVREYIVRIDRNVVQVIAVTDEQKILVIEQYRTGPEEILLDLPGGGIEKGETPEEGGLRELLEETGYTGEATLIHTCFKAPSTEGRVNTIVCLHAHKIKSPRESEKQLGEIKELTIEEFKKYVKQSNLTIFDVGSAYIGLDYIENTLLKD